MARKNDPMVFTVTVEGMELPEDVKQGMNEAIRRAALIEIAKVDLRGNDIVFRPVMAQMLADENGGGGGSGGGAHVMIAKPR